MPYGEAWKGKHLTLHFLCQIPYLYAFPERRKFFDQNLNASASRQYRPVSLTVTRKLLKRILDDSESQINILSHLRL